MRHSLVCLDMAGTTISDDGVVEEAASVALAKAGVNHGLDVVRDTMGQSKITVFRRIFAGDEVKAVRANEDFEQAYADLVAAGRIRPLPGAAEAIVALRERGMKVAFTTGFSHDTQQTILDALGWQGLADLALTPGPQVRGRPFPDLVLQAALLSDVDDVRHIVVAGDSVSDMGCGIAAGASVVAGVLGGAHAAQALRDAGATHLIAGVRELPALLD